MPKGIDPSDWDIIHDIAIEVVNASSMSDDILMASKNQRMLDQLAEFHKKYGDHPAILATIADYLDDENERKGMYLKALSIAKSQNDQDEIREIEDSLKDLELD
jgi:GH25 family lysozyme M1 (1,4-beta-N-acetylmuramidase)